MRLTLENTARYALSIVVLMSTYNALTANITYPELKTRPRHLIAHDYRMNIGSNIGIISLIGVVVWCLENEQKRLENRLEQVTEQLEQVQARQTRELSEQAEKLEAKRVAIETDRLELEQREQTANNLITAEQNRLARQKTDLEQLLHAVESKKAHYEKLQGELDTTIDEKVKAGVKHQVERLISQYAERLKMEAEKQVSESLAERDEIVTNLKNYKASIRAEIIESLGRQKLELDRQALELDNRIKQARLTIQAEKQGTLDDLKRQSERVQAEHQKINRDRAIIGSWLEQIEKQSKHDKADKETDPITLYRKYKKLLFEGIQGVLKPVHLRIIAGTEGGKSTLIQNLLALLTAEIENLEIIIGDGAGEYSKTDWGKFKPRYVGHDDCLNGVEQLDQLYDQREQGKVKSFHPVLYVQDETDETFRGVKGHALPKLLRKGRHQNIFVWLISQDKNVNHLGLSDSDRTNYSTLVMGNAITNFLNNSEGSLTSKQANAITKHWESLIDHNARTAIFHCLIISKHCPKPEILETPKPKAFESLLNSNDPETTSEPQGINTKPVRNDPQTTGITPLNDDDRKRILTLLEEFNGSLDSDFSGYRELAEQVIGRPSRSKVYKAKKAFLVSELENRGLEHLLPKN